MKRAMALSLGIATPARQPAPQVLSGGAATEGLEPLAQHRKPSKQPWQLPQPSMTKRAWMSCYWTFRSCWLSPMCL